MVGLKNLGAVSVLLLLANVSSFNVSAKAGVNEQSHLIAQGQGRFTNYKPHPVFQSILPKLQQKSQIRILLPHLIPGSEDENQLYAILETTTPKKYEILLGYSPDCNGGTACRLGVVTAEAVTRSTPRLNGKRVSLAKGITGYFVNSRCGANCSDATLTWRQQGVQYAMGIKAGKLASLMKMANSVTAP